MFFRKGEILQIPLSAWALLSGQKEKSLNANCVQTHSGGRWWIRTIEAEKQQIYSLPPLAAREISLKLNCPLILWSWWTDSNPRPADYKSAALPTELHQHVRCLIIVSWQEPKVNTFFSEFTGFLTEQREGRTFIFVVINKGIQLLRHFL